MSKPPERACGDDAAGSTRGEPGDGGFSLVEVLVSIVLLGLAAAGTLGATAASIRFSALHRDITNAQAWLQSAAELLQSRPREDCDDVGFAGEAEPRIRARYQSDVREAPNPDGWPASSITIQAPVLFWDGDQYQAACHDNDGINLQLVTISVTSPSGKVTDSMQVVRGA